MAVPHPLLGSNVGWHVTFYRGAVGPNINYQSCWVWYKDQNGTPHGGVFPPSSWRYEALKTQPLTIFNSPVTYARAPLLSETGPYFDYKIGHFGPKRHFRGNTSRGPYGEKPNVSGLFCYI